MKRILRIQTMNSDVRTTPPYHRITGSTRLGHWFKWMGLIVFAWLLFNSILVKRGNHFSSLCRKSFPQEDWTWSLPTIGRHHMSLYFICYYFSNIIPFHRRSWSGPHCRWPAQKVVTLSIQGLTCSDCPFTLHISFFCFFSYGRLPILWDELIFSDSEESRINFPGALVW